MKIPKEKFLTVNGHKISYFDEGKGHPILLLHGWLTCKETLLPLMEKLTHSFRVIAIDIPGFGLSEPIPLSSDLHEMIDSIEEFVRSLSIRSISVFGFSFGGILAMRLSKQYSELIQKFIVKSSPISYKQLPWFFIFPPFRFLVINLARISFIQNILVRLLKHFLMHYLFMPEKYITSDPNPQDSLKKYCRDICEKRFNNIDFPETGFITANFLLHVDLQHEMKKNTTPGMFRLNKNDPLIKYNSKYYSIPHTKVSLIEHSKTHSIFDEKCDTFVRKIKDFLLSKETSF